MWTTVSDATRRPKKEKYRESDLSCNVNTKYCDEILDVPSK